MSSVAEAALEPAPRAKWPSRLALAAMTFARLALAIGMMPYAVSKLFDIQFQVGASRYALPLGETSSKILTWAFLGYSPVFQFLLGAFEFVPAALLLFARTRRLGALLMFPVVLNVTMINYFLDLWPETQKISSVFLGLNLYLVLYDYRMYLGFLSRLVEAPAPIANRKWRIAAKAAGFLVPAALIGSFLYGFHGDVSRLMDPIQDFTGQRQINRAGTWKIESLVISGEPQTSATDAVLYFDFNGRCAYAKGEAQQISGKFEASASAHTFRLLDMPFARSAEPIQGTYRVEGDRLLLDGVSGKQPVTLVLHRDRWGHSSPAVAR